jgi:outer membrane protein assembly factor BamB
MGDGDGDGHEHGHGAGDGPIGVLATVGVALLALLTVGVVVFSREAGSEQIEDATELAASREQSDPPPELAEVWQAPDAEGGGLALWPGPGDAALTRVTGGDGGVEAFDTLDGTRLWRAATPEGAEPGRGPCAASERANADGVGAVLYRSASGAGCTVLALVDTRADGALAWSVDLADPLGVGVVEAGEVTATVGEESVTVSLDREGSTAGFHRFDLDSGEELLLPEPPGDDECSRAWHAGSRFLTLNACGGGAASTLHVYDADSGQLEWTHEAQDLGCTGMLAGDPVLLFEGEQLVAYSETGEELWRRPVGEEPGELAPGGGDGDGAVVVDGVLLSRYADELGREAYAGYGLADGEQLWTRRLPAGARFFGVDSNGLPLLGHVSDDRLRLLWLDPEDGTRIPAGSAPLSSTRAGDRVLVASDEHQLYVMTRLATEEPRLRLRAFER